MASRREEMREWFEAREELGWSLRELSDVSGIPQGTISWWAHRFRHEEEASADTSGFCRVVATSDGVGAREPAWTTTLIRVVLRDGTAIECSDGVSAEKLACVVAAVEERC